MAFVGSRKLDGGSQWGRTLWWKGVVASAERSIGFEESHLVMVAHKVILEASEPLGSSTVYLLREESENATWVVLEGSCPGIVTATSQRRMARQGIWIPKCCLLTEYELTPS